MSCSNYYDCQCGNCVTTTSTTTTTTLCPDAIPCDEVFMANCVVYTGCDDICHNISTGDSLPEVFLKIFQLI